MYMKSISLTNFRQFGTVNKTEPAITVEFNRNFNILVGENDSGKTAIIDAIRYLLGCISDDIEKIKLEDFYRDSEGAHSDYFYIEGTFVDLTDKEAGAFLILHIIRLLFVCSSTLGLFLASNIMTKCNLR